MFLVPPRLRSERANSASNTRFPNLTYLKFVSLEIREAAAGHFRPRLWLNLGIAALPFMPYLRVLASLLFFAIAEHNWKYSAFTGFVLAVLTNSLFLR